MESWFDPMSLMIGATLVEVAAVAALWWLAARNGQEGAALLEEQSATLERLRGDLGELVSAAERRSLALEGALAAREKRLRALLGEIERVERSDAGTARPAPAGPGESPAAPHRSADPAAARLLRELELRFGATERT